MTKPADRKNAVGQSPEEIRQTGSKTSTLPSRARSGTTSISDKSATLRLVEALRNALEASTLEASDRLSVSQLLFFLEVAQRELLGHTSLVTDIRETLGKRIGKTLVNTYPTLMEPDDYSRKNGLGWLEDRADPTDKRLKPLFLTERGRDVLAVMTAAMQEVLDDRP